jgi:hypothetical protein
VLEYQPRWSANYYSLSLSRNDGDDEYTMCASTDLIWRDVVISDITNSVRVVGKKLLLPNKLKLELKSTDTTSASSSVETVIPAEATVDMIDATTLADLRSRTQVARKMVITFHKLK